MNSAFLRHETNSVTLENTYVLSAIFLNSLHFYSSLPQRLSGNDLVLRLELRLGTGQRVSLCGHHPQGRTMAVHIVVPLALCSVGSGPLLTCSCPGRQSPELVDF